MLAGFASTATTDTMEKANTKRHWAAFSVAQYYDKFGRAARVRDLYPFVEDVFGKPGILSATMMALVEMGELGVKRVPMAGQVNAYYPIKPTIEELRELGAPTEMPDGSAIPDGVDLSLPTARVTPDEVDDLELLTDTETPSPFEDREWGAVEDPGTRVTVADAVTDDDEDDDEDEFECEECGRTFTTQNGLNSHAQAHKDDDEDEFECEECGRTFDTENALSGHLSAHTDEPDAEDAVDEEPPWRWSAISNTFTGISEKAKEEGLYQVARAYDNFAAMAMHRDLTTGDTADSAVLTKELAMMLLGIHPLDIDTDLIENEDVRAHLTGNAGECA